MDRRNSFKTLLGKQTRSSRKTAQLSQEKVAELANTGVDHLGRIERGEKQPTLYTFYKLSRVLNLDTSLMFDEIEEELDNHKF